MATRPRSLWGQGERRKWLLDQSKDINAGKFMGVWAVCGGVMRKEGCHWLRGYCSLRRMILEEGKKEKVTP